MTIIEIILVMFLYRVNRRNALKRNRKPTFFGAMTLLLWFGFEFVGVMICGAAGLRLETDVVLISVISLLAASMGGLISYYMARNCKPGDYQPPPPPWAVPGPDGKPLSPPSSPFSWSPPESELPTTEPPAEPPLPDGAIVCRHCSQRLLEGTEVCVNCGLPVGEQKIDGGSDEDSL